MTTIAAWITALFTCIAAGTALACSLPDNIGDLRTVITERVNHERSRAGLAPLARSGKLQKAAQGLACDNADQGQWSHTGKNGSDLRARLKAVGYRFSAANENVGRFRDAQGAVRWWMGSKYHRLNILAATTREIGVGIAIGRDGRVFWVTVSGAPR